MAPLPIHIPWMDRHSDGCTFVQRRASLRLPQRQSLPFHLTQSSTQTAADRQGQYCHFQLAAVSLPQKVAGGYIKRDNANASFVGPDITPLWYSYDHGPIHYLAYRCSPARDLPELDAVPHSIVFCAG